MIYLCPACGAHLDIDADVLEGDGERLKGFVEKDWVVTCGTCGQPRPAKDWVNATRAAGFPVKTPMVEEPEATEVIPDEVFAAFRSGQ